MKKFAVFDIDGTLIRWQLYHAIADAMVKLNFVAPETYDSVKAARMEWKRRTPGASFRSYEKDLIKVYEQVLTSLTANQFEQAAQAVFDEYKDQVYTHTRQLIKDLKAKEYLLFAISGSQTEIVELMASYYGFDDWVGTVYERKGTRFTGKSKVASHDKASSLKKLVAKHGASWADSIAVGDSASDSTMLELVERPIAFNPDQDLFKISSQQGWKIVLERKNMIYELEQTNGQYHLAKTNTG